MSPHDLSNAALEGGKATRRNQRGVETALDFPYSGNVTLKEVLAFACLSKTNAYKFGVVPEYGDDGRLLDKGKITPFPWIRMPHSLIRNSNGKKIFDAAEIRTWQEAVRDRSRQIDDATTSNHSALIKRGEIQHA